MADDLLTLADMTKINDMNLADIDVTNLLQRAPLLASLNAVAASNGDVHKYLMTTAAPGVGFRDVNAGRDHDSTDRTTVTTNCKLLDASFHMDKALAEIHKNGPTAAMAEELTEHLRAAFFTLEQQLINGTNNDSDGFTGMADTLGNVGTMVNDAGGTTALSSVYAIHTARNAVSVIAGHDGNIDVGDIFEQVVEDGTGKKFPALGQAVFGWYALQVGNTFSMARIANLDDGSNKMDDDKFYQLHEAFPVEWPPSYIVMNRRSLRQLQQSRTATNATGAPAPLPSSIEGVPIIVTDAISNAETQVT